MFMLYAKLGLEKDTANSGVLHLDETLLRIDRPAAEDAYNNLFYSSDFVPPQLRQLWDEYSFTSLDLSKATIGLTAGTHSVAMLFRYLNSHNINFQVFCEDGSTRISGPRGKQEPMPLAVKQFTGASRTTLSKGFGIVRDIQRVLTGSEPIHDQTSAHSTPMYSVNDSWTWL